MEEHEFQGRTKDGYDKIEQRIIRLKKLKSYTVVTIDQFNEFLKLNYKERKQSEFRDTTIYIEPMPRDPQGVVSYWNQLKHIYIVEKDLKVRKQL